MNLNIRQQFSVNAAPTAVWDFLQDGEAVGKCMPGVQQVERLDDHSYRVYLGVGIGPIQAKMGGKIAIEEAVPPERMKIRIDWKDSSTESKVGATANVELQPESESGPTTVLVFGQLAVMGALGKYGQPIANKKAADVTEEFARQMRAVLEPQPVEVAPVAVKITLWRRIWLWVLRLFGRDRSAPPKAEA